MINFRTYEIKLRTGPDFRVRPDCLVLDGKVHRFYKGWVIEAGVYKGETAMIPDCNDWDFDIAVWIASGDLELLP